MRTKIIFLAFMIFSSCVPSLNRNPLELARLLLSTGAANGSSISYYSVGGVVSGLSASSISLQNGSETLNISTDGSFSFATKIASGSSYSVSIASQPTVAGLTCSIANGSGTVSSSNITNINITCGWGSGYYAVGVNVSGLAGSLTVQNNGTDSKSVSSNGLTNFSIWINTGSSYSITIQTQPTGYFCSFENYALSTGTVAGSTVVVNVNCVAGYLLSGGIQANASSDFGTSFSQYETYITTIAGTPPPVGAFGSANGIGTAATFDNPSAIASDGTNFYIADYNNGLIRKYDIATGNVTTLAGGNTGGGTTCPGAIQALCKDGIGTAASIQLPTGITTDGTNLYVADAGNNRIRKIVIATAVVTTIAGDGNVGGWADSLTGLSARLNQPAGLTIDNGILYIMDRGNNRIRKMDLLSTRVSTLVGTGAATTVDNATGLSATTNQPANCVILNGYLYFTDFGGHKIRKMDLSGSNSVTTYAGTGVAGATDGLGTNAQLNGPWGIVTDGTSIFFSQNGGAIRKIAPGPSIVTTLTGGVAGYKDDATSNALAGVSPYLGTDGRYIYVSDSINHAIRRLDYALLSRYTLDGNSNDSQGTNHGTAPNGYLSALDENGTTNGSYELNGTNQYINTPALASTDTDDISMTAWVYRTNPAATEFVLYNGTGGVNGYGIALSGTGSADVICGGVAATTNTFKVYLYTWVHLAAVRKAGTWQIYMNGVPQTVVGNPVPNAPAGTFIIGDRAPAAGFYLKGKVSDVRFYRGALDAFAIRKIATQVQSGLVTRFDFNGDFQDVSGYANHGTSIGAGTATSGPDRFGSPGGAYNFSAGVKYANASDTLLPLSNNPRTQCLWYKQTGINGNNWACPFAYGTDSNFNSSAICFGAQTDIVGSGFNSDQAATSSFPNQEWRHVCTTYDGTNASVFINGALATGSAPFTRTTLTGSLQIGSRVGGYEYYGWMDDVRIYNRVLSIAEIRALSGYHPMQVSTWSITPGSSSLGFHVAAHSFSNLADGNIVGNWVDESGNSFTATAMNSPVFRTGINGINGNPTIQLNGTNQYFDAGNTTINFNGMTTFAVGQNNANDPSDRAFVSKDDAGCVASRFNLHKHWSGPGTDYYFEGPNGAPESVTLAGILNENVILTGSIQNATKVNLAKNGSMSTVGATASVSGVTACPLQVGTRTVPGNYFQGKLSEIMVFNRPIFMDTSVYGASWTDQDIVECYLSSKYGIPISHNCP